LPDQSANTRCKRPRRALFCVALAGSAWLSTPGLAQNADVPADSSDTDIIVNGQRSGYGVDVTSTATKTPTKLKDIPQAITTISEQQIADRAFRSIADVLRAVPGATHSQGEGHRDQIILRGNSSTADFFVDGIRDDVQYYRPLYNLDRVEVLRGPNAMTFGRGGGGGVINRVTKQAELNTFLNGVSSADSFGAWYVSADANLKLGQGVAARLNVVHEDFATHRQVYGGRVTALNPTISIIDGDATKFTLSYEFIDDSRIVDRGIPSLNGRPLPGVRDQFFGVESVNRFGFVGHVARGTVEHRLSDALTVTSKLLYGDYDKFYRNTFPAAAVTLTATGQQFVPVEAYFDATLRQNLFSQTDLVWRTRTGPIDHVILAGAEFGNQNTVSARLNGFFDGTGGAPSGPLRLSVPLADPFVVPTITFRPGTGQRDNLGRASIFAGYVQDQLKWGPVELLLGLRHDRFNLSVTNRVTNQRFERSDALWSPRVGLVYHPIAPVSLYFSYARSYLPQSGDQFTSLDVTSAALQPERFDNIELGAKWEPRPGLLIGLAAYQLDRTNTRAAGPNPGQTVLTGAQRSRGIELEAQGQIATNWQLSFAYALQEAKIVETTTAAPSGRAVPLVPRHSLSIFSRYDFTTGFGLGLGVVHQSDRFTSVSNSVVIPAFTRFDAALFFKLTDRIEAQINVENLFDTGYFPTAFNDNNISTGGPLNARGTLRFRL